MSRDFQDRVHEAREAAGAIVVNPATFNYTAVALSGLLETTAHAGLTETEIIEADLPAYAAALNDENRASADLREITGRTAQYGLRMGFEDAELEPAYSHLGSYLAYCASSLPLRAWPEPGQLSHACALKRVGRRR